MKVGFLCFATATPKNILFEGLQACRLHTITSNRGKQHSRKIKQYFRRKKEEKKQSFLAKHFNNRALPAAVTHFCRSGFMLLPVSFMLAL